MNVALGNETACATAIVQHVHVCPTPAEIFGHGCTAFPPQAFPAFLLAQLRPQFLSFFSRLLARFLCFLTFFILPFFAFAS